jgi:pimeloyl-ACP methyl ester carboxylesterase
VTPRLASQSGSCKDTLAADEINWQCAPAAVSWRSGGTVVDRPEISSFAAMDDLLRLIARKETFPNLEAVIVAGQSAGGQFVQRYALTSLLPETLGLVHFVVANPSSYAYLDASRPTPAALPTKFAAGARGFASPPQKGAAAFAPFADAANCTTFDHGRSSRAGLTTKVFGSAASLRALVVVIGLGPTAALARPSEAAARSLATVSSYRLGSSELARRAQSEPGMWMDLVVVLAPSGDE